MLQNPEFKENTPENYISQLADSSTDSPRRVSEFYYNEKSARIRALKATTTSSKKLIRPIWDCN